MPSPPCYAEGGLLIQSRAAEEVHSRGGDSAASHSFGGVAPARSLQPRAIAPQPRADSGVGGSCVAMATPVDPILPAIERDRIAYDEIYNSPNNLFVADFMGSPAMNLLEGKVARSNGARQIVIERHDHAPIVLPAPASADAAKLSDGRKVIFGIRPEAVNDTESIDRNAR